MSMLNMFSSQARAAINQNGSIYYAPNTDSTFKALCLSQSETQLHLQCYDLNHQKWGEVVTDQE